MVHYEAEIKEVMNETILKPSYHGENMTRKELIKFWCLDEPDIEWFVLYEVNKDGKRIKI